MLGGRKRDALISSGKTGPKVLLFGEKLVGDVPLDSLNHQNASVEIISFPSEYTKLQRLANYSLIVTDYAPFQHDDTVYLQNQEIFEKQMIEALDTGTTFCFVHYNEHVPREDPYGYTTGGLSAEDIDKCKRTQLGFRWLFGIRALRDKHQPLLAGKIKRGEFKAFLDKWGASHNYFTARDQGKSDDIIFALDIFAIGFTINMRRGRIIYLPFQRDFSRKDVLALGIRTLIDCLLTYITKSLVDIPAWGNEPFFDEEHQIRLECDELERKLEEAFSRLQPFDDAKRLLFESEYSLESSIPRFIETRMGIKAHRNEQYKEDFWLLNDKNEKVVIAEV